MNLFTASSFAINYLANHHRDNGLNKATFRKPNINVHSWTYLNKPYSIFYFPARRREKFECFELKKQWKFNKFVEQNLFLLL